MRMYGNCLPHMNACMHGVCCVHPAAIARLRMTRPFILWPRNIHMCTITRYMYIVAYSVSYLLIFNNIAGIYPTVQNTTVPAVSTGLASPEGMPVSAQDLAWLPARCVDPVILASWVRCSYYYYYYYIYSLSALRILMSNKNVIFLFNIIIW